MKKKYTQIHCLIVLFLLLSAGCSKRGNLQKILTGCWTYKSNNTGQSDVCFINKKNVKLYSHEFDFSKYYKFLIFKNSVILKTEYGEVVWNVKNISGDTMINLKVGNEVVIMNRINDEGTE